MQDDEGGGGVGLLANLFDHFGDLVGEQAASASLRYAAHQEGQRLGRGHRRDDLDSLLRRLDGLLGQESTMDTEGRSIRCTIRGAPKLLDGHGVTQAVTAGLFEGAFQAATGRPLQGRWDDEATDGAICLHLEVPSAT